MKDKLELYKDSFLLNLVCYSCNLSGHVAKFCPEVHYIPNREEIVKIKQKSNFKEMKNFKRFKRQKFKNLAKLSLVQTSAHAIRNTMFMYHEEGVKENCRFDMDMNDFLEENQKGMENLFEKMIPINKLNSFQLIINKKISKNDSDEKIVSNILNEEKSEPNRMDQINILKNWEIWNKFEEIRIFTKYFIHNNFSIIKKKLNNEKNKIKLASKRQSLQHRVHMIKNKTIKQIKNDLFASSLINEKSIENIQENRSHKILVSIDSIKECEKLIEKYGVENVYSIAKQKYKSLKSLE